MSDDTNLLAVLIDADNTSPKYTKAIFDEIASLGEASIRRIYGDFAGGGPQGWNKDKLAALAIVGFGILPVIVLSFAITKSRPGHSTEEPTS